MWSFDPLGAIKSVDADIDRLVRAFERREPALASAIEREMLRAVMRTARGVMNAEVKRAKAEK